MIGYDILYFGCGNYRTTVAKTYIYIIQCIQPLFAS